jgi:hypothetical protein
LGRLGRQLCGLCHGQRTATPDPDHPPGRRCACRRSGSPASTARAW